MTATQSDHSAWSPQLDGALILVVGAPRSGTNWLQRILAAHPEVVDIPGETYFFSRGIAPLLDRFHQAGPGSPTLGKIYADHDVVRDHVRRLCEDVLVPYLDEDLTGATRLLERTPEHLGCMDIVADLYPGTRFVHIIRDGRDVVRSVLEQPWGTDDAEAASREWVEVVEAGRRQGVDIPHYTEVRYEELGAQTEVEIRRLLAFLDLEADDSSIEALVAEARIVANTRRVPGAASGLSRRDRRAVERVAGPLLGELGYEDSASAAQTQPTPHTSGPHWSAASIHHAQIAVDRLLEALHGGADDLDDLLAPRPTLAIVGRGDARMFRGRESARAFLAAARTDPALSWRQVRGDIHASPLLFTLVGTYASDDGTTADRSIIIRLADDGIRSVTLYRHPLTETP